MQRGLFGLLLLTALAAPPAWAQSGISAEPLAPPPGVTSTVPLAVPLHPSSVPSSSPVVIATPPPQVIVPLAADPSSAQAARPATNFNAPPPQSHASTTQSAPAPSLLGHSAPSPSAQAQPLQPITPLPAPAIRPTANPPAYHPLTAIKPVKPKATATTTAHKTDTKPTAPRKPSAKSMTKPLPLSGSTTE